MTKEAQTDNSTFVLVGEHISFLLAVLPARQIVEFSFKHKKDGFSATN